MAVPMPSGTERPTTEVALTICMGFVARGGDVNLDPDEGCSQWMEGALR